MAAGRMKRNFHSAKCWTRRHETDCLPDGAASLLSVCALFAMTSSLVAQTPPRPAVRVSGAPAFDYASWPVDLNRDGRTDPVAASQAEGWPVSWNLVTALGRGDGTFAEPRSAGLNAAPMGVGDFNRDGWMDVVVTGVAILSGNDDGNRGAASGHGLAGAADSRIHSQSMALNADFDANGTRDLLLLEDGVVIYPGNGDFTFAPPVLLASSANGYQQAIVV